MIQRIQSLFLLAASICSGLMMSIPFSKLFNPDHEPFNMYFYGLKNMINGHMLDRNVALAGVTLVTGFLSFISIIIYRRRVLQMRICVYNILLTLAQFGLILYYFFSYKSRIGADASSFSFTIILPLVNIILIFQAFRAIRRDDLLLKSYDRLR